MDYMQSIKSSKLKPIDDAKRIFINHQSAAFYSNQDKIYEIKDAISKEFKIPFSSIQIAGSAQVGYSPYKNRAFDKNISDIDIAIIDSNLFDAYLKTSFSASRSLSDRSIFPKDPTTGQSRIEDFCFYIAKGWFRPDLMPNHRKKTEWFSFFDRLSRRFSNDCASINAGIFSSEFFFLEKQSQFITKAR